MKHLNGSLSTLRALSFICPHVVLVLLFKKCVPGSVAISVCWVDQLAERADNHITETCKYRPVHLELTLCGTGHEQQ